MGKDFPDLTYHSAQAFVCGRLAGDEANVVLDHKSWERGRAPFSSTTCDKKMGVSSFRFQHIEAASGLVAQWVAPLSGASNGVSGGHSSAASGSLTSVTQVICSDFLCNRSHSSIVHTSTYYTRLTLVPF